MKVKSENTKLIIWALVALVVGVVIGMIITNVTTGNSQAVIENNYFTIETIKKENEDGSIKHIFLPKRINIPEFSKNKEPIIVKESAPQHYTVDSDYCCRQGRAYVGTTTVTVPYPPGHGYPEGTYDATCITCAAKSCTTVN